MNDRIAVLCPSRDRPDAAMNAYRSMLRTSSRTDMILCVDSDQEGMYSHLTGERLLMSVQPRNSIVSALNSAASTFSGYVTYGLMVDDAEYTVPGWDEWVERTVSSFPARLGVVSAHHNAGSFVNFPYVSRQWIDLVGWYACTETNRFCWDTVMEMLGEATRIEYAGPEVFHIEHELLRNDETVKIFVMDAVQFLGWCVNGRKDVVQRIRNAIGQHE